LGDKQIPGLLAGRGDDSASPSRGIGVAAP